MGDPVEDEKRQLLPVLGAESRSSRSHPDGAIVPNSKITIKANGRGVRLPPATCCCGGATCLISRNHFLNYMIYLAVVCMYFPLVILLAASITGWHKLDYKLEADSSGGSYTHWGFLILAGLTVFPFCCCCHAYLQVAGKDDEDFIEFTLDVQRSYAPGHDPICYGEPIDLKMPGVSGREIHVGDSDYGGLVHRNGWWSQAKVMCQACRCMPERYFGYGSVMLYPVLADDYSFDDSAESRRSHRGGKRFVKNGDRVYISTYNRWRTAAPTTWGVRSRHHSLLDHATYVANDERVVATPFEICTVEPTLPQVEPTKPTGEFSLSVVAYNVWMMPEMLRCCGGREISPNKSFRAREIANALLIAANEPRIDAQGGGLCLRGSPNMYNEPRIDAPGALPKGLDVAVFSEAFCDYGRPVLLATLQKGGMPYSTNLASRWCGNQDGGTLSSGVVIASKHPIMEWDFIPFSDAVGDDAMARKGVVYARILKDGVSCHVFGSHTQAWQDKVHEDCRKKQFMQIKEFIKDLGISPDEPVLVCGDLNVNRYGMDNPDGPLHRGQQSFKEGDNSEYTSMLDILNVMDPHKVPELIQEDQPKEDSDGFIKIEIPPTPETPVYSADPSSNEYAKPGPSSAGEYELLDYVLVSKEHKQANTDKSQAWVEKLTSNLSYEFEGKAQSDLSDHFPVWAQLTFEF